MTLKFSVNLQISELGECVDDDAEDDVQSNRGDEDEKRQMKNDEESELLEGLVQRVTNNFLHSWNMDN